MSRPLVAVLFCSIVAGCGVSRQEVAERLGQQYVGQNVDALVMRFGPPSSSFRLNSGGTSYEWQLAARTDADFSGGNGYVSGSSKTKFCKVRIIAAPNGVVSSLDTEDTSGGVVAAIAGVSVVNKSLCAEHLGIRKDA
jgi:hypothetical protein